MKSRWFYWAKIWVLVLNWAIFWWNNWSSDDMWLVLTKFCWNATTKTKLMWHQNIKDLLINLNVRELKYELLKQSTSNKTGGEKLVSLFDEIVDWHSCQRIIITTSEKSSPASWCQSKCSCLICSRWTIYSNSLFHLFGWSSSNPKLITSLQPKITTYRKCWLIVV